MGKKPSVIVTPVRVVRPLSGEIWVDGYKYKVTFPRGGGAEKASYHYDFTLHPLQGLTEAYLIGDTEDVTAGTINHRCTCLRLLGEFMGNSGVEDLDAAVMLKYFRWLARVKNSNGGARFSETVIAAQVNCAVRLYEVGLSRGRLGWNQRTLDLIVDAGNKLYRGLKRRTTQRSIESAISVETFTALAKAVSLEMEECRRVLRQRDAHERESLYNLHVSGAGKIDPNPFVAFALEAGLRYGIRSQELNSLRPDDVRVDGHGSNHHLYVHAPDKEDDFIPIDEDFLDTLKVCQEWSKEARSFAGEAVSSSFEDVLLVYLPANAGCRERLIPLNTYNLNRTHLRYFYKKWFDCKVKDREGKERPLLHAEGDSGKPLGLSFRKIRNAFGARFIEREPNRAVAQRVLRHKSFKTTEQHYLHRTALTHARKVHIALESETQLLVLSLKNPVLTGISKETILKAEEVGAVTPHGLCGEALEGRSCETASDCLVCPYLVVVASRKPRFEADREVYLRKSNTLIAEGDHRGAENVLTRAKLCQAHINRIEAMEGSGIGG